MSTGSLKIQTSIVGGAVPLENVSYAIKNKNGEILHSGLTGENGESEVYSLETIQKFFSQNPNVRSQPYALYDVMLRKPGFRNVNKIDLQIFDGILTNLVINMQPLVSGEDDTGEDFVTPPQTVSLPTTSLGQVGTNIVVGELRDGTSPIILPSVVVPDYITVHLGTPSNTSAIDLRVKFIDYVKNVACSEIYPTWPQNSLITNINVIVTFALNRIYTEWYRARGFAYDITSSTTVDMAYVVNREIFQNVAELVDTFFNVYAYRQGFRNPYFTEFCNGTTATCNGLSQWGTVTDANNGLTPLQILRKYYPDDIDLTVAPSGVVQGSYPGVPLRLGSTGFSVSRIQQLLNRIRGNYPLIPAISVVDGVFNEETENAVKVFQKTFNLTNDGIVGISTWNKISQIFSAVTGLSELNGEGERIGLSPTPPTVVVKEGSRGADVTQLQFILDYIAQAYPDIDPPVIDSRFGESTKIAVESFQRRFGLTVDGIVGPTTWQKLYQVFKAVEDSIPSSVVPPIIPDVPDTTPPATTWPGEFFKLGSRGEDVRTIQSMLNNARKTYSAIPAVDEDGIFGPRTEEAVKVFQLFDGLDTDGIVGPKTWDALVELM